MITIPPITACRPCFLRCSFVLFFIRMVGFGTMRSLLCSLFIIFPHRMAPPITKAMALYMAWLGLQAFMNVHTADLFGDWETAESCLCEVVYKLSIRSSRRERRRQGEPFDVKFVRFQLRSADSDERRNQLSQRLCNLQQQYFEQRDWMVHGQVLSQGRNPFKKPPNLFPAASLEADGYSHSSDDNLNHDGESFPTV